MHLHQLGPYRASRWRAASWTVARQFTWQIHFIFGRMLPHITTSQDVLLTTLNHIASVKTCTILISNSARRSGKQDILPPEIACTWPFLQYGHMAILDSTLHEAYPYPMMWIMKHIYGYPLIKMLGEMQIVTINIKSVVWFLHQISRRPSGQ